jgi:hypothetical protein
MHPACTGRSKCAMCTLDAVSDAEHSARPPSGCESLVEAKIKAEQQASTQEGRQIAQMRRGGLAPDHVA